MSLAVFGLFVESLQKRGANEASGGRAAARRAGEARRARQPGDRPRPGPVCAVRDAPRQCSVVQLSFEKVQNCGKTPRVGGSPPTRLRCPPLGGRVPSARGPRCVPAAFASRGRPWSACVTRFVVSRRASVALWVPSGSRPAVPAACRCRGGGRGGGRCAGPTFPAPRPSPAPARQLAVPPARGSRSCSGLQVAVLVALGNVRPSSPDAVPSPSTSTPASHLGPHSPPSPGGFWCRDSVTRFFLQS